MGVQDRALEVIPGSYLPSNGSGVHRPVGDVLKVKMQFKWSGTTKFQAALVNCLQSCS